MNKFKYPLSSDNFTYLDRLKASFFILNKKNQFTMGPNVVDFEKKMEEFVGLPCLATSSGSTSNSLLFEILKQRHLDFNINDYLIICPAVTWISSITCATMAGFNIEICDINLDDFCFNYMQLEEILVKNKDKKCIIWPTALIGFSPNIDKLNELAKKYNVELFCDAAESLFTSYKGKSILFQFEMTTTSTFFSHHLVSICGGFVFFKNEMDLELGKMIRNHGLIRSLPEDNHTRIIATLENPTIDPQFLFQVEGTNWRMSDLHAYFGLLDYKRINKYKEHRKRIYNYYKNSLDFAKYYLPEYNNDCDNIAFCLPICLKSSNQYLPGKRIKLLKEILNKKGFETRPVIGSNITKSPMFQREKFKNINRNLTNSDYVHFNCCYVGLSQDVNEKIVDKLINILNNFN